MKKAKEKEEKIEGVSEESNNEILLLGNRIKELEEKLVRNQAELQNYKRRKEEEVDRLLKYKEEDILNELLPVIDNFERAISMDDENLDDELSKFLSGFKMIYNGTLDILKRHNVNEIESLDKPFDPIYHQAVITDSDMEKEDGIILEVFQKGYIYKDRVIRPAMVKVNAKCENEKEKENDKYE